MQGKRADFGVEEIVIVIIAVVFLGLAIYFMKGGLSKGEENVGKEIDTRIMQNKELMVKGELAQEPLAVSEKTFNIAKGKEETLFIIGVKNNIGEKASFKIEIDSDVVDAEKFFTYSKENVELEPNQEYLYTAVLKAPNDAEKGAYFFQLNLYGNENSVKKEELAVNIK